MYLRLLIGGVAFLVLVAIGWVAVSSVWSAIVSGRDFHSPFSWWDGGSLILWGLALVLFTSIGALFESFVPSSRPLVSAAVAGIVVGALICWVEAPTFTALARPSSYVWAYGTYALAPIGMALGSALRERLFSGGAASA
jgi:hypothetical protein